MAESISRHGTSTTITASSSARPRTPGWTIWGSRYRTTTRSTTFERRLEDSGVTVTRIPDGQDEGDGRAPAIRRAHRPHHRALCRDGSRSATACRSTTRRSGPDDLKGMKPTRFDPLPALRRRYRRHGPAVHRGAGSRHRGAGRDAGSKDHDRRVPDGGDQAARRGLHPLAGEGPVPPRLVLRRILARHPGLRRHSSRSTGGAARHRPDEARHHARRDDLFLRSVGQPQRDLLPAATSSIPTGRC